jgi:DNA polymerase-3 subunit delta
MAENKVVIIKNAHFLANIKKTRKDINHNVDSLNRYLQNAPSETILIIQAPYDKLDERKAITKILKSNSTVEECAPLQDQDLRGWINRQLGKNDIRIDNEALQELLKRVENNTEVLVSEVSKLLLYAEGLERIDLDMIKRVITKNVEDNVYEITNMLLENNRSKALEIYHDLVMHSEDPLRILGILVNKYREIIHTKMLLKDGKGKNEIAEHFRASSGRAYYMMKNAKSVRSEVVLKHLRTLEEIDYQIKTGQIDKNIGLELFILGQ